MRTVPPPAPAQADTPVAAPASRRPVAPALILLVLLVVGGVFRFNGLNWDDGKLLHPDELHVTDVIASRIHAPSWHNLGQLLDPDHSPLNPRSVDPTPGASQNPRQFAYGSLPLFVTDFSGWVWGKITGVNWNDFWRIFRVGRALSVIFDLVTILLTYGLARRAYGTTAGLLAAACFTLATMPVQLAHFFVTDTWLTTFVTAALWATLVAAERGRARDFALAGLLTGCAMATKGSVVLLGFAIVVAVALAARRQAARQWGHVARSCIAAGVAGAVAFFLFEPYAVLNPKIYLRDLGEQSAIISGRFDVPYTRQFVGTLPLVYQAKQLVGWELGPLLGALVLAAFAWALWRALRRRRAADLVLLAWVLPYLLLLALNEAKFPRYLLPVLPVFCAFGGALLADLGAFRPWRRVALPRWQVVASTALAALIIAGTFVTTLAFSAIYSRPHTQVAASEWIYSHIPREATISAEYWDHPLPLPLGAGQSPWEYNYQQINFDLYNDVPMCVTQNGNAPPPQYCAPNNQATFTYVAGLVHQTDYIIEATQRLYKSIPDLPWRYPVQQQFYALLFSGQLGYALVYDGNSFPTLGPYTFDDTFMDESFTVYDHPRVLIFKKTRQLSQDELRALFAPAIARPLSATRTPPDQKSLLLPELVDRLPAVADYAWNATLGSNGVVAALLWLVAIEALGLAAAPLAFRLFHWFPDRGWGLSKLLGWLVFAYPIWLAASVYLGRFTLPYELVTLACGLLLSALAAYRWRRELRAIVRGADTAILVSEGVFLIAAAFFLALRIKDPDLWHTYWGGEKPMELTHLNGILRSVNFPPYDPWYADGIINYYYYGQYLVATLVKLTGIPVDIAFNLALATVAGLIATAGCSVAGALASLALRRRAARLRPVVFGVLGAVLLIGIGNLDGMARLVGKIKDGTAAPFGFNDFVWGGSRTVDGAITEFPFFSLLYADLHAHLIALPFTLLALGLAVAIAGRPIADTPPEEWGLWQCVRGLLPRLAPLALTLGALACINSWDVPTYLLVTAAALFHAARPARRNLVEGIVRGLVFALGGALATGAAAYALYLPFFRHFQALFGSLARTRVPTPPLEYLDHFGLFIGVVLVIIGASIAYDWQARSKLLLATGGLFAVLGAIVGLKATALTLWAQEHTRFFQTAFPSPPPENGLTAALLAALLLLLVTMWVRAWGEPGRQLPLVLLIAGVGVTLGPELVFLADDLQGGDFERMNTIFKFYFQGWTLFAIGSAGALAWLYDTAPRWSVAPFHRWRSRADRRFNAAALRGLAAGFLALLLAASFVYPVVATPLRVAVQFPQPAGMGPTLDGFRWMLYGAVPNEAPNDSCGDLAFADDYAAIKWLNANIVGTPVLAEAAIGPYRGNGSRFAIDTGLPTIIGWDRHEYQQRPPDGIATRMSDVRTLYNSPDVAQKLAVIDRYHVSYIAVGAVERGWYLPPVGNAPPCSNPYASKQGLDALAGMVGQYVTPVFQSGNTVIYQVLASTGSSGAAVAR